MNIIQTILQADAAILLWIQENLRTPWLTPLMIFITSLGTGGCVWVAITAVLLVRKETRKAGILSLMALLGSLLINNLILKNLVARTRPYEVIPGLELLVGRTRDFSFPSGHTGSSMASAWAISKEVPRPAAILLLVLAVLIGFSRMYVGIHYPTDVLAGMITGILTGETVYRLYEYGSRKRERQSSSR